MWFWYNPSFLYGKIYIIDAGIGPDVSVNTTGIITASSFVGNGSSLTNVVSSSGYADRAGIATNVIGGIASVTSLDVSGITTLRSIVGTSLSITGISTLGTVQISSGIITATTGVVTYYGDGSNLEGVNTSGGGSFDELDAALFN